MKKFENVQDKKNNVLCYKIMIVVGIVLCMIGVYTINKIKTDKKITQYSNEVVELFDIYDISDLNIDVKYRGKMSGYNSYDVKVNSEEFENLSNKDKFDIVNQFSNLSIRGCLTFEEIISNKNQYKLDILDKSKLKRNNEEIYSDLDTMAKNIEKSIEEDAYVLAPTDEEKAFAWAVAKKEVKNVLKSPSTSKFPFSYNNEQIKKSASRKFQITSYVDAENGFGATIRTNFIVEFTRTGEESYKVISVNILE